MRVARHEIAAASFSADLISRFAKHRGRSLGESTVTWGTGAAEKRAIKTMRAEETAASVRLRVVRAAGLVAADSNGASDPYCEAYVFCPESSACSHMWRTQISKNLG